MTQHDLDRAVARATGEPLSTIHQRGFGLLTSQPVEREPLWIDWDLYDLRRNVPVLEGLRSTPHIA